MAKKATKPEPESRAMQIAALCGTLSGASDHIAELMETVRDVSGRAELALEIDQKIKVLSSEDKVILASLIADRDCLSLPSEARRKIAKILEASGGWR